MIYYQGVSDLLRRPLNKVDVAFVVEVILHIARKEGEGAILVFLPGWQEIASTVKELDNNNNNNNKLPLLRSSVLRPSPLSSTTALRRLKVLASLMMRSSCLALTCGIGRASLPQSCRLASES